MAGTNQIIKIGRIDGSDTLGQALHQAALTGNKRDLKRVLEKGLFVDYPNDEGQTPLFCACYTGEEKVVEYLLTAGAQANERSNSGLTPVHAACYSGKVKILMQLLQNGADLRLHDNSGRSCKDWAMLQPKPKKRIKMLEFLDKCRLFAMSHDGQDLLAGKASSLKLHGARRSSVRDAIHSKIGKASVHNLEHMATSKHTIGFGQIFTSGRSTSGFLSAVPIVSENCLRHDPSGETYSNGAFATMEGMLWNYTSVTVKKMKDGTDSYTGGVVDLFITELEHIGKLRHPHVLLLMGVCQNTSLDGLVLIYEKVGQGSLYSYLHDKNERLSEATIQEIAMQMCNAIIFLHLSGFVHCSITSHAISVINQHTFKLGNFEYMIESSQCDYGKKSAVLMNTKENSVYNWMAPEMVISSDASFYCDMYSYCAVLWEVYHGDVPYNNICAETIRCNYSKAETLKVLHGQIPDYFRVILEYGLKLEPYNRKLSFLHVRDLLIAEPKDANQFIQLHFLHLMHDTGTGSSPMPPEKDAADEHTTGQEKSDQQQDGQQSTLHQANPIPKPPKRNTLESTAKEYTAHSKNSQKSETPCQNGNNLSPTNRPISRREKEGRKEAKSHGQIRKHKTQYNTEGFNWDMSAQEGEDVYEYRVHMHKSPEKHPKTVKQFPTRKQTRPRYIEPGLRQRYARSPDSMRTNIDLKYEVDYNRTQYTDVREADNKQPYSDYNSTDTEVGKETHEDILSNQQGKDNKKPTSMAGFSYLTISKGKKPHVKHAKPACHTSDTIEEEYSTAGKLTTAGSLYGLYNDHSPDRPRGQLQRRKSAKSSTPPPQTKPLKSKVRNTPPRVSPEKDWFGGRNSVRDLAVLFQDQIYDHKYYQSVLDGKLSTGSNMQLQGLEEEQKSQETADGAVSCPKTDTVESSTDLTSEWTSSVSDYNEQTERNSALRDYETYLTSGLDYMRTAGTSGSQRDDIDRSRQFTPPREQKTQRSMHRSPRRDGSEKRMHRSPRRDGSERSIHRSPRRDGSEKCMHCSPRRDGSERSMHRSPRRDGSERSRSATPVREQHKETSSQRGDQRENSRSRSGTPQKQQGKDRSLPASPYRDQQTEMTRPSTPRREERTKPSTPKREQSGRNRPTTPQRGQHNEAGRSISPKGVRSQPPTAQSKRSRPNTPQREKKKDERFLYTNEQAQQNYRTMATASREQTESNTLRGEQCVSSSSEPMGSQVSYPSDNTTDTGVESVDSDEVTLWVDEVLRKMKRKVSAEMDQCKKKGSPDLFKLSPAGLYLSYSTSSAEDGGIQYDKDTALNEYYYDEVYDPLTSERMVNVDTAEPVEDILYKSVLPMETVMKQSPRTSPEKTEDVKKKPRSPRKGSKIPKSRGRPATKTKSSEGVYANIVMVKTSLDDLGKHEVIHKMKNLKTGGTKTLHNDIVNARTVVTSFDTM